MTTLLVVLVGLLIGFLSGYAGIGGAPLMIAALVFLAGLSQLKAQGVVLTMMLGPMSLLGLLTLRKEVRAQLPQIFSGVLSYAFFSYFGARLAFALGEGKVRMLFGVFLVFLALTLFILPFIRKEREGNEETIPVPTVAFVTAIMGMIGGLFGIGAGVLMVPLFIEYFHMKKNYARALSLAILLPPVSLGAFIAYAQEGSIYPYWSLILFVAYFFANYFGAKLGNRASLKNFSRFYALILLAIGVTYLVL